MPNNRAVIAQASLVSKRRDLPSYVLDAKAWAADGLQMRCTYNKFFMTSHSYRGGR
jgi:hypothetical protein